MHQARVGGSFRAFFPPIPQSAAGVCNKMASCSRRLSVSGTASIAHELPIMVVETCSDGVDQYSRCRSTTAHGKPRGTLQLLFNAAHHHGCLYTSGCRLALVILHCLALFFQAAAQSPPPPQSPGSPYPGWDRQLLYSSYYVYYPINEGTIFSCNFLVDSERCVLLTYICATHVEYIFIFQKQDILYFAGHSIGRNT